MSIYRDRQITENTTDLDDALRYCRSLAKNHYENFIVGSLLVPCGFMQHLYNLYAFCRHSDDLADEVGDNNESLKLLGEWREELHLCYEGRPKHPIMLALRTTVEEFDLPEKPLEDLISAFEQDCRVTRYETFEQLLGYCERSANPVGRLFLWIFGYRDAEQQELSDRICTGLQLANFWQDIVSDYGRGRIYLPMEDMDAFGCSESDIAEKCMTPAFKEMMRFQIDRTEEIFKSAATLPPMLNWRLGVDVELFRRAGLAVTAAIRRIDYNTLACRPTVSKVEKARLLLGCVLARR